MVDNNMFNNLSDEQIEAGLIKYKNVPSIITLLEGIKQVREASRQQAMEAMIALAETEKVKVEFASKIAKLAKLPAPPEGIVNVYLAWTDMPDTTKPEEVEVVKDDGSKVMETRYPTIKGWKVETNRGFQVSKSGQSKGTTTKRAIVVSKRVGNTLELVGNFKSASQACEYLKLPIGADSASRVLQREGYFSEPYTGLDFTIPS